MLHLGQIVLIKCTWIFTVIHFLQGSEIVIKQYRLFMLKSKLSARMFQVLIDLIQNDLWYHTFFSPQCAVSQCELPKHGWWRRNVYVGQGTACSGNAYKIFFFCSFVPWYIFTKIRIQALLLFRVFPRGIQCCFGSLFCFASLLPLCYYVTGYMN